MVLEAKQPVNRFPIGRALNKLTGHLLLVLKITTSTFMLLFWSFLYTFLNLIAMSKQKVKNLKLSVVFFSKLIFFNYIQRGLKVIYKYLMREKKRTKARVIILDSICRFSRCPAQTSEFEAERLTKFWILTSVVKWIEKDDEIAIFL